jgi:hypothetical protein
MSAKIIAPLFAAAALALSASPSHAILQIAADINGVLFSCQDGAACDLDTTPGRLNVGSLNLGGVTIEGTFQRQTIATGVGTQNLLSTTSFDITNNNAGTVPIVVAVGGKDFLGPAGDLRSDGGDDQRSAGVLAEQDRRVCRPEQFLVHLVRERQPCRRRDADQPDAGDHRDRGCGSRARHAGADRVGPSRDGGVRAAPSKSRKPLDSRLTFRYSGNGAEFSASSYGKDRHTEKEGCNE